MSLKNFMSYEDAEEILGEYADAVNSLKSGLTNVQDDVKLNTQDLTTPSRTKNLLPLTIERIKALNTTGTWSGNDYTINGGTFTVYTDDGGNVTSIKVNGTFTNVSSLYLISSNYVVASECKMNGCPDNGTYNSTYSLWAVYDDAYEAVDSGNGITLPVGTITQVRIRIAMNYTANNLMFYPMIRPASITDPTFAPYIPSVESRIEAVESGLTNVTPDIKTVTASPDVNGFINLSTYGYSKNSHKYVNAVVVDNNYNIKMWKHSSYGWVVTLYTAETFTRVTDTTVSVDLVVFGIKA